MRRGETFDVGATCRRREQQAVRVDEGRVSERAMLDEGLGERRRLQRDDNLDVSGGCVGGRRERECGREDEETPFQV